MADANFTDGSAYTLTARVTDNSLNPSTATITKGFNWKSSATSATITSGMPSSYSSWTTLGAPNPGVQVSSTGALVTTYSYQIVSGATCPTTGYPGTWTPVATKITDSISSRGDGQYTLCVIGRDEAENVQVSATPSSWYKDTQAPNITAMASQTVNSAYAVNPTVTDNIDALASLTYAWTFVSSASNRCTGASFSQSNIRNPSISATGCTNSWGAVTVRLTVTDQALNSATSDLTINWDQQPAYVSAITSTLTAGTSWKALSAIPIKISFTKDTGNFNRNSFNLVVSGTPTITLNVLSTGGGAARTAALTAGTYTNNGSGVVTVDASYTVQAGDADQFAAGVVLNAAATTPFTSATTVVDNTGAPGTAISNTNATTGSTALSNANIRIDTVAPTSAVTLSGPAANGYVNLSNSTSTTALSTAATGINETTLSSTSLPAYKVITKGGTCSAATTGMSSTVPSPSTASMNTITEATYVICIKVTDPAGNDGYSVSGDIVLDRTPPVFTSMALANEANDGRINNTEQSSALAVASAAVSSGADATSNAVMYTVTQLTDCSAATGYASTIPAISAMNADGTWYVCVKLTDKAANITYGQSSSIIRQTTPAVIISTSFQWTGDAADFYLNGTEKTTNTSVAILSDAQADKAGSTFKYTFGLSASTTCNSSLTYSLSAVPNKASFTADGTYKACVEITDTVGNKSYYSTQNATTNTLTVDTALPSLTFDLSSGPASDTYINLLESSTTSALATVTGVSSDVVSASTKYRLIASGTSCASPAFTTFSTTVPLANSSDFVADGTYQLCAWLVDTSGNNGFVTSSIINLKKSQPTLSSVVLANDVADGWLSAVDITKTTALVTVTSTGATATNYVVVSSSTTCSSASGYSATVPLSNSSAVNSDTTIWIVCVRIQDAATNYQYSASPTFKRDIQLPTLGSGFALTGDASGGYINDANKSAAGAILTAAVATDANNVTYRYATVASATTCNVSVTYATGLPDRTALTVDGTYKFCAEMKDDAGNIGYATSTNLIRDTAFPTLGFSSGTPSARSKVKNTLSISISSTDTAKYYYAIVYGYKDDGVCSSAIYAGPVAQGTNITTDLTTYNDGWLTVCARAQDAALNTQTVANVTAYSWIKDTASPEALTITAPTSVISSTSPTVTWTTPAWVTSPVAPIAADPHTITLKVARDSACTSPPTGASFASIAGVASTTQSQALTATLADGLWYVCMTVTDAALNVTTISGQFEVETDTVHVSWTDSNGVKYARYENLAWTTETVGSGGGTYDGRTSLQLDGSGVPYVSFKLNDGTNTSLRYRKRASANSWSTGETTVATAANSTSTDLGAFNELAIITQQSRIQAAYFGMDSSSIFGLTNIGSVYNQIPGAASAFTDMTIGVGIVSSTNEPVYSVAAQSGLLKIVKKDATPATLTLPASCANVSKVSAANKDDNTIGLAIACLDTGNTCSVYYGDVVYTSSSDTYSGPTASGAGSWTTVGTIKSSGCTSNTLTDDDRPSIMVDRQSTSKAVSIVWDDQSNKQLNRWTNESGSGVNTTILTGATSIAQQTVALDQLGKAYIIYKDGDALKYVTNNGRITGAYTNVWSSPSTIVSGTSITGVGTISITGMKGRGNFTGGK